MENMLNVKGITYDIPTIIKKFEGEEGVVEVVSGPSLCLELRLQGAIDTTLIQKAIYTLGKIQEDFGGGVVDFQIWLRNDVEIHPEVENLDNFDLNSVYDCMVWLH